MIEWIISSSLLILIVLVVRTLTKSRLSCRARYALWLLVLVRLLIPVQLFTASWGVPEATMPERMTEKQFIPQETQWQVPADSSPAFSSDFARETWENAVQAPNAEPVTVRQVDYHWSVADVLRTIRLTGAGVMAAVLLVSNLRFARRLRRTRVPYDALVGGMRAYVAEGLTSPCLVGVLRPTVYLTPESTCDERTLRHVLAHETTHRLHGDCLWSLLRLAALCLHWYNPLVWLAVILSKRDGELACDEATLARLGEDERAAYGETLLSLVRAKPNSRELLSASTAMTAGRKPMRERIETIARHPRTKAVALILALAVLLTATALAFSSAEAREDKADDAGTTAETEDTDIVFSPKLSEAVRSSWTRWDSMDEMTQALQSTSPGYCTRNLSAWAEGEDYIGTALWNPLEDAPWLVWRNFTGSDTLDPFDNVLYHAHLTWTGERDGTVTYIGLTAGYTDGDVRVIITAEPLNRWAEPDWTGAEQFVLADGNRVSLKRDSGERYDALDLYTYKDNAHYTVRLISNNGAEALDAPLERVLGALGLRRLTLDDVRALARKGETLTPQDFAGYEYFVTGSGLYIKAYPIDEVFSVWLGFADPDGDQPLYYYLNARISDAPDNDRLDLRTGDAEAFIAAHAEPPYRTEGTVFIYHGEPYDLTEQSPSINAITQVRRAGKYYVIEGHVNPNNSVYCVFDTETERFIKKLTGANLIWQGDDLTTAVYSFWSEILDYKGNTVASCDLSEGEYIYSLGFDDDGAVLAAIMGVDGTLREERHPRGTTATTRAGRFTDLMGLNGWYVEEEIVPHHHGRSYYTEIDGETVRIAESFNFELDDHVVDLDGDGLTELICNCVYGGDGAQRVYVYRRKGDVVERATLDYNKLELTAWEDWGVNSTAEWFDPASGTFMVEYASLAASSGDGATPGTFIREVGFDALVWEEYAALSGSNASAAQPQTPPAAHAGAPVSEQSAKPTEMPLAEQSAAPAEEPENSMVVVIDLSDYEGGEEP